MKTSFAWLAVANVGYGALQLIATVVLIRMTSAFYFGSFALATAILTPLFVASQLQLRQVLATDYSGMYSYRTYVSVRIATTILASLLVVVLFVSGVLRDIPATVLVAVLVSKCTDSAIDLPLAFFQRAARTKPIAISLVAIGILSALALYLAILHLARPAVGLVLGSISTVTILAIYVLPATKPLARSFGASLSDLAADSRNCFFSLIRITAPLGLTSSLIAMELLVPRYVLARFSSVAAVGYYSALMYLLIASSTATRSLGQALGPKMSQMAVDGNVSALKTLVLKLNTVIIASGATFTAGAYIVGGAILERAYGSPYGTFGNLSLLVVCAATLDSIASFQLYVLTSLRVLVDQAWLSCAGIAAAIALSVLLVPEYGLRGAVLAAVGSTLTRAIIALWLVFRALPVGAYAQ